MCSANGTYARSSASFAGVTGASHREAPQRAEAAAAAR
eukprot:CAMPEP_0195607964 /NCGR_PEP_ID=MMETSP0815-20121206/8491_1 /TAXON_ID=97485 /ORGANISM="Prymnesium parvum, Strain Texoma1" /LENGTH=37 /DNA_ID= /DNA_START= /DNA_END= /DNA_ORIENTATION=